MQPYPREAGSEVSLAAAVSPAPTGTWLQAAGSPGPREGMAEQEASGLQVLLRTLQVGGVEGCRAWRAPSLWGPACWEPCPRGPLWCQWPGLLTSSSSRGIDRWPSPSG